MNLHLLIELTKRDFVDRYSGSILGRLWVFLWPLINMAVYMLVFAKIMGAKLPGSTYAHGYGVYLIAGLMPWTAFSQTIARTSTVFLDKKQLITKIKLSLPTLPLFIVMSESIVFLATMLIYLIFLLSSGVGINETFFFIPFIFVAQQILAYALGFLVATLQVFIRDLKEVVGVVIFIWFWLNPIVYVANILPERIQSILVYNPSFWFIDAYQKVFIYQQAPNFTYLIYLVVLGHVLLGISYLLFKKLEKDVRDCL